MSQVVALTGTPGVGKSSTAKELGLISSDWKVIEVADLGRRGPRPLGTVTVDLGRASVALRSLARSGGFGRVVIVGHLSHLLPIRDVVVLRCRPSVLAKRLARKRVAARWVRENEEAERLDVILLEAIRHHRTIWEIDTTRLTPHAVAAHVRRILEGAEAPGFGGVDWLAVEPPRVPARRYRTRGRAPPRGRAGGSSRQRGSERKKSPRRSH